MDSFKEFEGRSLDEVISEACDYFDLPREKLEIEILQDAKSGIFGLVGARKAKVRARRVTLRTAVEDILGRKRGLTLNTDGVGETDASAEKAQDKDHDRSHDKAHGKGPDKGHDRGHDGHEKRDKTEKHDRQEKSETRSERDHGKGHERAPEKSHAKNYDKSHDKDRDVDAARKDRHSHHEEHHVGAEPASDAFTETAEEFAGPNRMERSDKTERDGRSERTERFDSQDRSARPNQAEQPDRPERQDRSDRSERQDKPERGDVRRVKSAPKAGTRRTERLGGERPAGERLGDGRNRPKAPPRLHSDENTFSSDAFSEEALREDGDDLQRIPFEDLDQDRLRTLSLEVVGKLVAPIVGELPLTVELQDGRVNVRMDCGDDSGLLIGREGQTLASLQYLASRMVSRGMNTAVRVQLDAGEYRLRQDEKLREMALGLAEKVRASGKSHSTRPLSSYHRRIVHLVLQDSTDVQTRSSGDGPLKRVVVQRKRG